MRYLSICSGVEAASLALEPLGWEAVAFSEIEPFPSAVLAHRFPHVPNLGDMTRFEEWPEDVFAQADVIIGGCPCQDFSIAGLRAGLGGDRGNLTLVFVQLIEHADRIRSQHGKPPVTIIYENVPGLLNSKDGAFGNFLGALAGEDEALEPPGGKWSHAGAVFGPRRDVAWRLLDARHFQLAQRRQRVFVIAGAPEASPSSVLFEPQSLPGDSEAGGEPGQDPAPAAGSRAAGASGSHWDDLRNPHPTLNQAHNTGGLGGSNQELFSQRGSGLVPIQLPELCTATGVASTLSTENGGKRSSPRGDGSDNLVVAFQQNSRSEVRLIGGDGGIVGCLAAQPGVQQQNYVAFGGYRDTTPKAMEELMPTMRYGGEGGDNAFVARVAPDYIAFGGNNTSGPIEIATARNASASPSGRLDFETETFLVEPSQLGVRRITPEEAEALMGMPAGWTRIPWGKKPAEECPDGHRQKAIGNSFAVPCIRWLGQRIMAVQEEAHERQAAD